MGTYIVDIISVFFGGFFGVVLCAHFDSWQRYREKVGKDAWRTVYEKVLDIEKAYAMDGEMEAVNDCIKLENLLNYFKSDICSKCN